MFDKISAREWKKLGGKDSRPPSTEQQIKSEDLDYIKNTDEKIKQDVLAKLVALHSKSDKTKWHTISNLLTREQIHQVLDELSAREWARWEAKVSQPPSEEQQAKDDALYRAGGLHYAKDGYYLTIFGLYDMVNGQGAYENDSLDNVKRMMPKVYAKVSARRAYMNTNEQFLFFSSQKSFLANHFPSSFELEDLQFASVLHYMMYAKAELFRDREVMRLLSDGKPPKYLKRLGRKVKYFQKIVWEMKVGDFLEQALRAKFTQNEDLKTQLLATQGKTLAMSCAKDKVWGIGLSTEEAQSKSRQEWPGKNLLGEALTSLRIELGGGY